MTIKKIYAPASETKIRSGKGRVSLDHQGIEGIPETLELVRYTMFLSSPRTDPAIVDEAIEGSSTVEGSERCYMRLVEKRLTPEAMRLVREAESVTVYGTVPYGGPYGPAVIPLIRYRMASGKDYFEREWQFHESRESMLRLDVNLFDAPGPSGHAVKGGAWHKDLEE